MERERERETVTETSHLFYLDNGGVVLIKSPRLATSLDHIEVGEPHVQYFLITRVSIIPLFASPGHSRMTDTTATDYMATRLKQQQPLANKTE